MTEKEKKLLQAKHRMEEAEARNRKKERSIRTRRLIQEGAILESVFPQAQHMDLRELRKQVAKITQVVMDAIPALAEGLESLRQKVLVYRYQFLHFRFCRREADQELRQVNPDIRRFEE